jgi:steroid delta-isomerase-like uncharacterized protein
MSTEENKALMWRYFEEVWNKANFDFLNETSWPDMLDHNLPPGMPNGIQGHILFVSTLLKAFPDNRISVEDVLAEGDKVVVRFRGRGTHTGELMGIPPTGRVSDVTGITIARFEGGKVKESWTNWDQLGMMQQLGLVPPPSSGS